MMDFSSYKALKFRRDGRILHVTLNRPDTLNAVDGDMDRELGRVFGEIAEDAESSVVVVTGAGRAFSAGGNVEQMQEAIDQPDLFLAGIANGKRIIYSILDCPKPIIAKVNGPAIGLGATVALICDIIIAANDAKIADPHVRVGYAAGDGGCVIWPQLIGYARAKEYLFTGDSVTGEEAARIGLINRAVPGDQLDQEVDKLAQRLAQGAARAIQWTKQAVNIGLRQQFQSILDASFAFEALSSRTKDHQEAVNAFREKRKPVFSGK